MNATTSSWERFQRGFSVYPEIGMALDISRVDFPATFFADHAAALARALAEMETLEKGAIANPTENRMVGHYWLRQPALAPTAEIRDAIQRTIAEIKAFAREVHDGTAAGATGSFKNVLLIGIGGSALGPQFVAHALGHPLKDKMEMFYFDNTDPDGMDRVLARIGPELGRTLCIVISKSGTTPETANGMVEAEAAYRRAGLAFHRHAVAITMPNSKLDQLAKASDRPWLRVFPMWDWVGGRTSETSAVGLLPAALQGLDIDELLAGARACDELTRRRDVSANPAAQLALMWFFLTDGRGARDMVVLPYKDRLELFARYLQQLVMESLGKERDREGRVVHQGITVYGNKGSTDQHAYVQQLRDGVPNFFVVFLEVLRDRPSGATCEVEPGITSGDYLSGFLQGTRHALHEKGRQSITLTLDDVTPQRIGALIALFERAVGLYANLVNINAYDQPGVQAGKLAAAAVLKVQARLVERLAARNGVPASAEELARELGEGVDPETVFKVCEHLAANSRHVVRHGSPLPAVARYARA